MGLSCLDRLVIVGECAVDVLLGFVGGRAAVEIIGVRGIEAQCVAVIADRAVEIALGEFCGAAEVVGIGQVFQRFPNMPALASRDARGRLVMVNLDAAFVPRNAGGVQVSIMRASSREDGETQ